MKKNAFDAKKKLFGDTVESLAAYLGMTRHTLSRKINGKAQFRLDEIAMIADRYKLTLEELKEIFFEESR